MIKFNLLKQIPNIRNTVTKDTPIPGEKSGWLDRIPFRIIVSGGVMAVIVAAALTITGNEDRPFPAPTPDIATAPKKVSPPAQKPAAVVEPSEPAPDEIDTPAAADVTKPVLSRPVAQEASAARPEKRPAKNVWRVRFAVCILKKSCDEILAWLKKKGVDAYVTRGEAILLTHRLVVGPWPTAAHAEMASAQLERDGVKSALFSSSGRYYLSTEPFTTGKGAGDARARAVAMGYRAEKVSKKETRKVYKVYEGAYKDKRSAYDRRSVLSIKGIDCVVERGG